VASTLLLSRKEGGKIYRQMEIRRKREMESQSLEDIEWCEL